MTMPEIRKTMLNEMRALIRLGNENYRECIKADDMEDVQYYRAAYRELRAQAEEVVELMEKLGLTIGRLEADQLRDEITRGIME